MQIFVYICIYVSIKSIHFFKCLYLLKNVFVRVSLLKGPLAGFTRGWGREGEAFLPEHKQFVLPSPELRMPPDHPSPGTAFPLFQNCLLAQATEGSKPIEEEKEFFKKSLRASPADSGNRKHYTKKKKKERKHYT